LVTTKGDYHETKAENKIETVPNMIQEDDVGFVEKNDNNPGSKKLSDKWDFDSKEGREEVKGEVGVGESDDEDVADH